MFNVKEASIGMKDLFTGLIGFLYGKSCLLRLLVVVLSQWLEVFSPERVKKHFRSQLAIK